jgi:hypothetical protein
MGRFHRDEEGGFLSITFLGIQVPINPRPLVVERKDQLAARLSQCRPALLEHCIADRFHTLRLQIDR